MFIVFQFIFISFQIRLQLCKFLDWVIDKNFNLSYTFELSIHKLF